jgi:hypothetical protein
MLRRLPAMSRAPEVHTMLLRPVLRGVAALLLSVPAVAQTVDRIVPEAFAPGDVVTLHGSGLSGITDVPFTAIVGGFVGQWTIVQPIATATDTEVQVIAPLFNSFVPPFAGSSPFGTVGPVAGKTFDAFYMEGTFGQVDTAGKGSQTPGSDLDKLVVSFDLAKGAPEPGNANFTLLLQQAPPGGFAFVLAGQQAAVPVQVGGGVLVVDVAGPFLMLGPFAVGGTGDASAALPLPVGLGVEVALQWGMKDPGSGKTLISNALIIQL